MSGEEEEILEDMFMSLAALDDRRPDARCTCEFGRFMGTCADCVLDDVRALVEEARARLDRLRLGVVAPARAVAP